MTSGDPAVSVITLTYNHARFISEALESLRSQSFPSWEAVVLDDGSTDGTPEIVRRYRDPRIRLVSQEHRGLDHLPETYNRAFALCRANIVGFLDGDDLWPADKLETLVPAFRNPEVVLAYGITRRFGPVSLFKGPIIPTSRFFREVPPGVLTNTPVGSSALAMMHPRWLTFAYPVSVLLRRDAVEKTGGLRSFPGLSVVDYPTFLRLALEGRFHYVDRTMGYWRVHGRSVTTWNLDVILEATHQLARDFWKEHSARLPFPAREWERIEEAWERKSWDLLFWRGRRLVMERRWSEARAAFERCLRGAQWFVRIAALAALAASWFERDIESLIALVGEGVMSREFPRRGPLPASNIGLSSSGSKSVGV